MSFPGILVDFSALPIGKKRNWRFAIAKSPSNKGDLRFSNFLTWGGWAAEPYGLL